MKINHLIMLIFLGGASLQTQAAVPDECQNYNGLEERANVEFIYPKIIEKAGCPACHRPGPEAQNGGLEMETLEKFKQNTIDIKGTNRIAKEQGWVRIKKNDYKRSFLVRKLELPGVGEGNPMPFPNKKLNEPFLCVLKTWIANGAN